MYYLIFILLLFGSLAEFNHQKSDKIFNVIYIILSFLLIFRYGQGTDYFNYKSYYDEILQSENDIIMAFLIRSDWGYVGLNYIFVLLGISYEYLVMFVSFMTMICFYPFFNNTCNKSITALFAFYCVIFMIYPMSSVRQGLSMGIFYGLMYPLLEKKSYTRYYALGVLAYLFHASSAIFFILPLLNKHTDTSRSLVLFIASIALILIGSTLITHIPLGPIQDRLLAHAGADEQNSIMPKLLRFMLVAPLFVLNKLSRKNKYINDTLNYINIGFFFYALTSFSDLVSGRLWAYFYGFFCLYLSQIIKLRSYLKKIAIVYYLLFVSFLWFKDINAVIGQGGYVNCNVLTYPYISLFEGDEVLDTYRKTRGYESEFE